MTAFGGMFPAVMFGKNDMSNLNKINRRNEPCPAHMNANARARDQQTGATARPCARSCGVPFSSDRAPDYSFVRQATRSPTIFTALGIHLRYTSRFVSFNVITTTYNI